MKAIEINSEWNGTNGMSLDKRPLKVLKNGKARFSYQNSTIPLVF